MNQLTPVCLSLAPNLRCVGFTVGESAALIIPPAVEVVVSLIFICLCSGPARWMHVLLVADSALYFAWALLDMLSRVISAVRMSISIFRVFDIFVGAASFTTILFYGTFLYRLSDREFISTFPRNARTCLEISLFILLLIAVALNEVSSLIGTYIGTVSNPPLATVQFAHGSGHQWFALSRSSLATYTTVQFLFCLLTFSRLSRAFTNQRRIELTQSDENHYFNGIAWITAGTVIGVIESATGFAGASFGIILARRILRLIARGTLMLGLLKGLDVAENFHLLTEELRGASRFNRRISRMTGVDARRNVFRRISRSYQESSSVAEYVTPEKHLREQRVTIHYEKGQAPFLQIRFSALDFPAQAILADDIQQRRRSHSGLVRNVDQDGEAEMVAARNTVRETPRAKSALVLSSLDNQAAPDWMRPPKMVQSRPESGGTISDSLSIVRDLERKFPSLPPRVTGKYRGSILGQNYEEDLFPVVGVSRQSSLRKDGDGGENNQSEEGGPSVTALSSSGSIKRKPAPPLLDNMAFVSERRRRLTSTWGGLVQDTAECSVECPVTPTTPSSPGMDTIGYTPDTTPAGEHSIPTTPRSLRIARDVIRRASRAMSDASIRSAEWLASAKSPQTARTPLTAVDIEMYRRGTVGPGSARLVPDVSSRENPFPSQETRRSADVTPGGTSDQVTAPRALGYESMGDTGTPRDWIKTVPLSL